MRKNTDLGEWSGEEELRRAGGGELQFYCSKNQFWLKKMVGMVVYTFNPSIQEAEL